MTEGLKTYFALLQEAIWGRGDIDVKTLEHVNDVVQIAQQQGTGTLIFDQILKCPELADYFSSAERMRMKAVCARSMMAQEEQRQVRKIACDALEAGGITPVLLKGLSLARLYPKPYLRSCSDVDIYVGKENYHPGAKILRETFPDAPRFDTEEEYFRHYNLNVGSTAIEMHRVSASFAHPNDIKVFDALERVALQKQYVHFEDAEDAWNEPEWKFNVLFVFVHSWEHFVTESANIRQFCDLALLIDKGFGQTEVGEDIEDYLRSNLRKLHLLHAWQLYAYIMVNYLGLPKDRCPLYTAACRMNVELLLEQVLARKTVIPTPKRPAPKNVILRKLYTLRERILEAQEIAKVEPYYARHMVATAFAQSWDRFKKGENTRTWE